MLGRDAIGNSDRLVQIAGLDQRAASLDRGCHDLRAWQILQAPLHRRGHRVQQGRVGRQQDGLGVLVVLGLGEQIHRQPVRIAVTVADDHDFRRAGDGIDADLAEDPALGRGHIGVTGADNLVHRPDGFGAVGQRGDGLRTADAVELVHASQVGRGLHDGAEHAIGRRCHHDDFSDTGHLGRNRIHQYGRGIGGLAAGDIDAHAVQRRDPLTQHVAVLVLVAEFTNLLSFGIGADAALGGGQRILERLVQRLPGRLALTSADFQINHRVHFAPVKAGGEFQQRRITATADLGDDPGHALVDRLILRGFPIQQLIQRGGKIDRTTVQAANFKHRPAPRAACRATRPAARVWFSSRPC